jgi:hypothetical protein
MAAEGLTGRDGVVEVDAVAIGVINEWSLSEKTKTQETGGFGSQYSKKKPTIIDGSGSCKGTWARGDAAGQGSVDTKFRTGTLVSLTLGVSDQTGESYVYPAYITELKSGAKWDGAADFEFSFETFGEPTTIPAHS